MIRTLLARTAGVSRQCRGLPSDNPGHLRAAFGDWLCHGVGDVNDRVHAGERQAFHLDAGGVLDAFVGPERVAKKVVADAVQSGEMAVAFNRSATVRSSPDPLGLPNDRRLERGRAPPAFRHRLIALSSKISRPQIVACVSARMSGAGLGGSERDCPLGLSRWGPSRRSSIKAGSGALAARRPKSLQRGPDGHRIPARPCLVVVQRLRVLILNMLYR